ncbi:hypothetical protein FJO69_01500 [[Mycoplasma] falconis]|uniref:Oligopeptide ABC transporter substrate-binding protein n=1 Tax=[Mycoplasma] falconis TaxID=92403 RepID=A0A501XAY8_9BACT|nr:hypothetical protein [[Mycoplasma] falconis]TPE57589.1 hypothetical protein FJO69_01500 [[Mycoplasma] falconis]
MRKKHRLWLLGVTAVSPLVASVAALSCTPEPAWKRNEYVEEYNATKPFAAYNNDPSMSYGSVVPGTNTAHLGLGLVRYAAEDKPATQSSRGVTYITAPSYKYRKLELASAIVLTLNDDTVKVYDNDKHEVRPGADGKATINGVEVPTYSAMTLTATSTDERSINNEQFAKDIANAKKLQFKVREGVTWTNDEGQKLDYKVVPEDFKYGWMRTLFINQSTRHKNGGSEALDDLVRQNLFEPTSTYLSENISFSNIYLYDVFGMNTKKLLSGDILEALPAAANLGSEQAVTVEAGEKPDFASVLDLIMTGMEFMPAPSEYINAMNATGQQPLYKYDETALTGAEKEQVLTAINAIDHNSWAYKIGQYWYGVSVPNTLYSGYYYLNKSSKQNGNTVLEANPNYWDKTWVENENKVKKISFKYKTSTSEATVFANDQWNAYNSGIVSALGYNRLNDTAKVEVDKNPTKYGLFLSQRGNTNQLYTRLIFNPWLNPDASKPEDYQFSDAWAKMMYGGTRKEIMENKTKGVNDGTTYLTGTGLQFRTLLNAAINWQYYSQVASNNTQTAWLAQVADSSLIGTRDANGAADTSLPLNYDNQINALSAVGTDGNLLSFVNSESQAITNITGEDNDVVKRHLTSASESIKSVGFVQIKSEMAKLIAEFDKNNPELAGQEFSIKYFFPYSNQPSQHYRKAYNLLIQAYQSLNPRLKFEFVEKNDANRQEISNIVNKGFNGSKLVAWGYDFNSSTSGYDGLSWAYPLIPSLVAIHNTKSDSFNKSFPEIAKLAEWFVKYESEHKMSFPNKDIQFSDLGSFGAKFIGNDMWQYLQSYVFQKNDEGAVELVRYYQWYATNSAKGLEEKEAIAFEITKDQTAPADHPQYGPYKAVPVDSKDASKGQKKVPLAIDSLTEEQQKEYGLDQITPSDLYTWSAKAWLAYGLEHKTEDYLKLMQELTTLFGVVFVSDMFRSTDRFTKLLMNEHYNNPFIYSYGVSNYYDWTVTQDEENAKK